MDFSSSFLGMIDNKTPPVDVTGGTSSTESSGGFGLGIGEALRSFFQPKETKPTQPQPQQTATNKIDPEVEADSLISKLIFTESNGIHREADGTLRVSEKGAQGITQLMPKTAGNPGYGITPLQNQTPEEYIRFGKDYLTAMIKMFDDTEQGVAAYNAGPGAVHRAISKAGRTGRNWKEFLPHETKAYIKKVTGRV